MTCVANGHAGPRATGGAPRMCVTWEVEHGWLKELKIRQLTIPRHLYIISRRGARLPHAATEFMRILKGE